MKLVLANNHTARFEAFYDDLQQQAPGVFTYGAYETLLFRFGFDDAALSVTDTISSQSITDYDGVYLNGYLDTYELAATLATCLDALGIAYVNRELSGAPALSKLTTYAKLATAQVRLPRTVAGAKRAILHAGEHGLNYPLVLKRADADRGIDNYKVRSWQEVEQLLEAHDPRSIWLLQEYLENDGFYLVSFYSQTPKFCIFRSLEDRPDGDEQKAHMYKPKGGANARLFEIADVPATVVQACQAAMDASNRQIGSVDCIYQPDSDSAYVLEVNYNPQLVTIETFKDIRVHSFLDGIQQIGL